MEDALRYFSESLEKDKDWFWDWVNFHNDIRNKDKLIRWFETASRKELLSFYKTYEYVIGPLIPNYRGIYINEEMGCFSEDSMGDFNNWIIVQGYPLWKKACELANIREQTKEIGSSPMENDFRELIDIYDNTRIKCYRDGRYIMGRNYSSKEDQHKVTWKGCTWEPLFNYFPAENVLYIYEERFGGWLTDEL
jgi:hypothetical protein